MSASESKLAEKVQRGLCKAGKRRRNANKTDWWEHSTSSLRTFTSLALHMQDLLEDASFAG